MKHYYSTYGEVVLTFSDIVEENFLETITLYFERANDGGGSSIAEIILPNYTLTKSMGFTEDEVFQLERYAKNNAPLIWELALRSKGDSKCLKQ